MAVTGLQRLLAFVDFLKSERISFSISYKGEGSITVDFGLLGVRIEADFYEDYMIFAPFFGDERVSSDEAALAALFRKHGEISYPGTSGV
jgi:hypothetical protein